MVIIWHTVFFIVCPTQTVTKTFRPFFHTENVCKSKLVYWLCRAARIGQFIDLSIGEKKQRYKLFPRSIFVTLKVFLCLMRVNLNIT